MRKTRQRCAFLLAPIVLLALSPVWSSDPVTPNDENGATAVLNEKSRPTVRNPGLRRANRALNDVATRMVLGVDTAREFRGATHEYLRFDEIPDVVARRELQKQGILLTDYAGDQTYIAAVKPSARGLLESLAGVRRAGPMPIEAKLEAALLEGRVYPWAKDASGRVSLNVRFHRFAAIEDARTTVLAHGGVVLEEDAFPGFYRLGVSVNESSIFDLAGSDLVQSVSMRSPKAIPMNADAAARHKTDLLWLPPYNLNGAGLAVGMWDIGTVHPHAEFGNRLTYANGNLGLTDHATHVAGTIAAAGTLPNPSSPDARGMASMVNISSYNQQAYNTEMLDAVLAGNLMLSSHPWGFLIGWWFQGECTIQDGCLPPIPAGWVFNNNQGAFGNYDGNSQAIDQVGAFAEDSGQLLLIVTAAGNDRDDPTAGEPLGPHDGTWYNNPDEDAAHSYYDCIGPQSTAKNNVTVGSIRQNKEMTLYSGWGPTDDGRIKPDLVAVGDGLFSPSGPDGYEVIVGTSQAQAVVSGTAVLLAEQYETSFGFPPTNGELKALLLNSALDLGNPGPDYVYGFGMLQAQVAADTILEGGDTATFISGITTQGQTDSYAIEVIPGTPSIKATMAWMDWAAVTGPGLKLVNNLDMRLISPSSQVFFPYSLNPVDPVADATAVGTNFRDTVEQILVEDPEVGTWTLEVTGTSVPVGPQPYGVVSRNGLSGPEIFDFAPPNVSFGFPYSYRRPVMSAKYVDPLGAGIDPASVKVRLNSFDVTSLSVIDENGIYLDPTFDLWLDLFNFNVTATTVDGLEGTATAAFNVVDVGVGDLDVQKGASGEAILNWGFPTYDASLLGFREYRVFRSTDLQTELELIATTGVRNFTDPTPPAGLVHYEVHGVFEGGSGYRVLNPRSTPHRTEQPFLLDPRDMQFAPLPPGTNQVRFRGMAEPGSQVTIYADAGQIGQVTTQVDGSFSLIHDFGGPGVHDAFVQAKSPGKGISLPSVEVDFEILP